MLSVEICLFKPISGTGLLTNSVAEAVFPFPPSVDVTAEVVLFFVPVVAPVTVTLKVQLLFAASDPPVKEIEIGDVVVSEPPQVEVGPELATVTPEGRVSVKPMPDSELEIFGLVIVKDNVEVLPTRIDVKEKDLAMAGGAITVSEAVA